MRRNNESVFFAEEYKMGGKIPFLRVPWKTVGQVLWNLGLIIVGSCVCAVALNGILIPKGFVSGGVAGLALIVHHVIPNLPVSILYLIFNIPLFALGWKYVGRRFFLSSAVQWIYIPIPVQDKFLCAILAGIIMGVGTGIILRSVGSSGGTDILSVMVLTRFAIRMGNTVIAFNTAILIITALLFSLESALYTLIFIYVTAHFLNLIVTGLSQRKSVMIISKSQEEIVRTIMKNLNRGVTVIKGRGGYTGELSEIIYTVITFRELSRLKRLITRIDPDAFVVVSDTTEVIGHRIGNQPHW
jgi:uncharacterized membrane-anchored protein YitT (DUF2179 family)